MRTLKTPYVVSSQNVSANTTGAFTGEIAASQLADFGIKWTIIGHSERRQLFHTTDSIVAKQITLSLTSGLNIIACVGETITERKANKTWAVVQQQLDAIIAAVKPAETFATRIVVAYEPVWAIGTGETATPAQAQEVHAQIRAHLKSKLGANIGGEHSYHLRRFSQRQ